MLKKFKKTATATHIQLDDSFLDLTVDEQLDIVNSMLSGLSPNEKIRRSAKKIPKSS
jgi:hypothetical protein